MSTTISYENEFNSSITEKQASMLGNFVRIIKNNNVIKIKEEYKNNELWNVVYYQENETVDQILAKYPVLSGIDIAKKTDIQGNYIKEETKGYLRNEGLKLYSFSVENIITGKTLCFGDIDIQTGSIIPESVIKLQYNNYGDLAYYYHYNEQGKIDYIEEVDNRGVYANEFSMDYYNNALQLFP